jgi:hypothetical protein
VKLSPMPVDGPRTYMEQRPLPADTHGTQPDVRGTSADIYGTKPNIRAWSADIYGTKPNIRGLSLGPSPMFTSSEDLCRAKPSSSNRHSSAGDRNSSPSATVRPNRSLVEVHSRREQKFLAFFAAESQPLIGAVGRRHVCRQWPPTGRQASVDRGQTALAELDMPI